MITVENQAICICLLLPAIQIIIFIPIELVIVEHFLVDSTLDYLSCIPHEPCNEKTYVCEKLMG